MILLLGQVYKYYLKQQMRTLIVERDLQTLWRAQDCDTWFGCAFRYYKWGSVSRSRAIISKHTYRRVRGRSAFLSSFVSLFSLACFWSLVACCLFFSSCGRATKCDQFVFIFGWRTMKGIRHHITSISTTTPGKLYSCEQISHSHERYHLSELDHV